MSLSYFREFHFFSVTLRLLLALASGAAIGYGRSRKQSSAGIRTYMLVSLGAALTILISMYESDMLHGQWAWAQAFTDLKFDGSRFSAQVINGVGFLAAGTILGVAHQQVSGLTTAIGLFVSAGLGIAAGSGFYECVLIAVPVIVVAMDLMKPLEVDFKRRLRNITIFVEFEDITDIGAIKKTVEDNGARIFGIDVEHTKHEGDFRPSAIFTLKLKKGAASHSAMLSSIAEMPHVYAVSELIS